MIDPLSAPRRIRLVRVEVPLLRPHRAAHGEVRTRDLVLVEWTTPEGVVGWGECPTLGDDGYVTESTDVAWAALTNELAPAAVAGRSPLVAGVVAATGSLRDARLDAQLRARGESLVSHLGGTRRRLPRSAVIAELGAAPGELVDRARSAVRAGARTVKVKVTPQSDVGAVAALVGELDGVPVAVDANGSFRSASELAPLDAIGLSFIEQPVAASASWEELAALRSELSTRVALDESLPSADAVNSAVLAGALDVVSVKPARMGGVEEAARAVGVARSAGVAVMVGGMLELAVGRATAAALASLPGCSMPTDLGPSSAYVERDVAEPVDCDPDGMLLVPDGPGCARTPDPARLAEVTVAEVVVER